MQVNTTKPAIILHEPQMGENIGAAARIMLNFGLNDLRLVNPRDGWPNDHAVRNGAGAFDTVNVRIHNTLETAIENCKYVYATTARRRGLNMPVYTPHTITLAPKTAIVFGRERTGLENKHVALCNGILTLPINPDFPSLNLAQAVGVTVYALCHNNNDVDNSNAHDPADAKDTNAFLNRLKTTLNDKGFFRNDDLRPKMQDNIRALINRMNPNDQELRILQGMLTALSQSEPK